MRKGNRPSLPGKQTTHEKNYPSKDRDLLCGQEGLRKGNQQGVMEAGVYLLGRRNSERLGSGMEQLTQCSSTPTLIPACLRCSQSQKI